MPRPYKPWLTSEIATLRAVYPSGGWQAVHALLPDRSRDSIHQAARLNGIKLSPEYKSELSTMSGNARWKMPAPSWSDEERAILRELYPDGGWKAVHERLPHRSRIAICLQASKMGVTISEELSVRQHQVSGRLGGRHRHPATIASIPPM